MKVKRSLFSALLVIVLCMSLTVTAFAASNAAFAGIYGTISGTSNQSGSAMAVSTSITTNPDKAYLQVTTTYTDGGNYSSSITRKSGTDVTSFSTSYAIAVDVVYTPTKANTTHLVMGGVNGAAYVTTTSVNLNT